MSKLINELNKEELIKVFHANSKLRDDIQDDMQESEFLFIRDWFDGLQPYLKSWSYGICDRNEHIQVKDDKRRDFIEELQNIQADYSILSESDFTILNKGLRYIRIMDNCKAYNDRYYKFDEKLDELIKTLTRAILKYINTTLESSWDEKNQLSYFIEFYASERMENCYIEDKEDYTVYEDLRKSYK